MAHKMPEEICCHVVDDNAHVTDVVLEIKSQERIALFCEGVRVSRKGQLSVVIIGTTTKAYIFDVLKLGKEAFNNGLRDLLQDKTKEKLMFDCREDSDCLYHQFKVQLSGVLDLQLLEVMHRTASSSLSSINAASPSRRSKNVNDIDNVTGFVKCLEVHTKDTDMRKAMDRSGIRYDVVKWLNRPLQKSIEAYCCAKTSAMFTLFENLNGQGENIPRLRVASDRYVNLLKDKPRRRFDILETHTYLPLDIIPLKGALTFPLANTKCVICQRLFTREEFSKTQLRKKQQKCRVCKKVLIIQCTDRMREQEWEQESLKRYEDYNDLSDEPQTEWQRRQEDFDEYGNHFDDDEISSDELEHLDDW